jgi:hypothetical protein
MNVSRGLPSGVSTSRASVGLTKVVELLVIAVTVSAEVASGTYSTKVVAFI